MSCVRMSGSTFCMSRSKFVAPSCDWRKSSCRKTDLFSSTQLTGSLSLYIFTRRSCSVASSSFSASPSSSDSNLKPSVLLYFHASNGPIQVTYCFSVPISALSVGSSSAVITMSCRVSTHTLIIATIRPDLIRVASKRQL